MPKRNKYFKTYGIDKHQERMISWFPEHRKWIDLFRKEDPIIVFFMNSCPTSWHTDVDSIMQILNESWTGCFTRALAMEIHHIRVTFEGKIFNSNWWYIGYGYLCI